MSLKEEFDRAYKIIKSEKITTKPIWKKLLQERAYLQEYKHFIEIKISVSQDKNMAQQFKGYVQSKIRSLVLNLEKHKNCMFHPIPTPIDNNKHDTYLFIAIKIKENLQHDFRPVPPFYSIHDTVVSFFKAVQIVQNLSSNIIHITHEQHINK